MPGALGCSPAMQPHVPTAHPHAHQVRARVGPFECITSHRFSDFLRLQRRLQLAFPKRKFAPSALKLREQRLQLQPHRSTATVALARSSALAATRRISSPPACSGRPSRPERSSRGAREELERSSRGTYCAPRHRHTESRMRLLQRYCEDVCAQADIASSSVMVAFFWPSEERGDGPVVAPDGSRATMLGGE